MSFTIYTSFFPSTFLPVTGWRPRGHIGFKLSGTALQFSSNCGFGFHLFASSWFHPKEPPHGPKRPDQQLDQSKRYQQRTDQNDQELHRNACLPLDDEVCNHDDHRLMEKVEGHDGFVSVHKPFVGEIEVFHSQVESIECPTPTHQREGDNEDDGPRHDECQSPIRVLCLRILRIIQRMRPGLQSHIRSY